MVEGVCLADVCKQVILVSMTMFVTIKQRYFFRGVEGGGGGRFDTFP